MLRNDFVISHVRFCNFLFLFYSKVSLKNSYFKLNCNPGVKTFKTGEIRFSLVSIQCISGVESTFIETLYLFFRNQFWRMLLCY